ncbi:hypothetical protein LJB85_02885 [Porphyromonadaceae bacterium OttesenSCG-928-L07]|nr:hypothetical protein [Porphyromonadaceae bacterium OttesenSCG-928-L07]MDL2252035.1 hypothetical protein [Odoribacter sp. OttesenSCG-928-J03]MDL2331150.1 hypothetical protein [Odoribacter sp. OttesenSCG-928-A06]
MHEKKIVYLKWLISRIKEYHIKELDDLINIDRIQEILDSSYLTSCNWEHANEYKKEIVLYFLETYISVYQKVIKDLEEKKKQ